MSLNSPDQLHPLDLWLHHTLKLYKLLCNLMLQCHPKMVSLHRLIIAPLDALTIALIPSNEGHFSKKYTISSVSHFENEVLTIQNRCSYTVILSDLSQ